MADTFVKKMILKPVLDLSGFKNSVNEISQTISNSVVDIKEKTKEMTNNIKNNLNPIKKTFSDFSLGFSSTLQQGLFGFTSLKNQLKEIDYQIKEIENEQSKLMKERISAAEEDLEDIDNRIKSLKKSKKNLEKKKTDLKQPQPINMKEVGEFLGNALLNVFNKITDKLRDLVQDFLKDVKKEFKEMASYSLSTSLTINTEARDRALMYGLSNAQNYAFSKVSDEMDFSSIEDITLFTPAQRERFADRIGYYTSKYEELANRDFFTSYEQYNAAMRDFREELKMSVIQFIVDNKETIMSVMKFLMEALKFIMNAITAITNKLRIGQSESQTKGIVSDIINNYANSSNTTTVKVDNSFSGIDLRGQAAIEESINKSNEILIQALNGNLG